jgi:rhodanese-related sulfurtransferase
MFRPFTAATILAFVALAGPPAGATDINKATLGETTPTADISTAELQQCLKDSSAIVVDTRTVAEYDAGHIPGAKLVERTSASPVDTVDKLVNGNKAAKLVLYCNGPYCKASRGLATKLVKAGYTNVTRYQLGLPVWRALGGGPVAIERGGITRIFNIDRTAVFVDTRPAVEFAKGTLANARNLPADELVAGNLKALPLPEDDFNRRIILFGSDGTQAAKAARALSKRPWHNVAYFPGTLDDLRKTLKAQ